MIVLCLHRMLSIVAMISTGTRWSLAFLLPIGLPHVCGSAMDYSRGRELPSRCEAITVILREHAMALQVTSGQLVQL